MALVRVKEQQAERLAHLLDDVIHIPGTSLRIGADPLLGLIPLVGDAIATAWGASILVIARRLNVPWSVLARMGYNVLKNGLIGAVPFVGDLYSFTFKSNAINAALLLRAVRAREEGSCPIRTGYLTILDVLMMGVLVVPIIAVVVLVSAWFWNHNISYFTLFFPPLHQTR